MSKVIVTGGRHYTDREILFSVLNTFNPSMVIEGGCPTGADALAREWTAVNKVPGKTYYADWNKYGRGAGPIRNRVMLDENKDALVVAFPGGKGTDDCVKAALDRQMRVYKAGGR